MIVDEVERLRWRIWNGKAKNGVSIGSARSCISTAVNVSIMPGARHRADYGMHHTMSMTTSEANATGWSITPGGIVPVSGWEVRSATGTANFLVNRHMNKSQQMRRSRRGPDLLMQLRCASYNGTLGSGFGETFHANPARAERSAHAA
jgi:hypothetical protein